MSLHRTHEDRDGCRHAVRRAPFDTSVLYRLRVNPVPVWVAWVCRQVEKTVKPSEHCERREKGHLENVRLGLQCGGDGLVVCKLLAELVDELPDPQQVALHRGGGRCGRAVGFLLLFLTLHHLDRRRRRSRLDPAFSFFFALAMAAASLSGLSASVTRILSLTGFPKELKTKDIQSAFSEWENVNGGFKIKWRDDTSLLIVFQDATVGQFTTLSVFFFSFFFFLAVAQFASTSKTSLSAGHRLPAAHLNRVCDWSIRRHQALRWARRTSRHPDRQRPWAAPQQPVSQPRPTSCLDLCPT